jgi:hypothetical protein
VTNRLVCAVILQKLASIVEKEVLAKVIVPIAYEFCGDVVANVRFNGVLVLEKVMKKGGGVDVKQKVEKMVSDGDLDVQYFAKRALCV